MIRLEDDFHSMVSDRHHDQMKKRGEPGHPGFSASTCHECFKVDPTVTNLASEHSAQEARSYLSSQQWKEMFGK